MSTTDLPTTAPSKRQIRRLKSLCAQHGVRYDEPRTWRQADTAITALRRGKLADYRREVLRRQRRAATMRATYGPLGKPAPVTVRYLP